MGFNSAFKGLIYVYFLSNCKFATSLASNKILLDTTQDKEPARNYYYYYLYYYYYYYYKICDSLE